MNIMLKVRNPFKSIWLAKAFEVAIESAEAGHYSKTDSKGVLRRRGGATHRCAFWEGYENAPVKYMRDSIAYACYRAGQEYRKAGGTAPDPLDNGSLGGYMR